MEPTAVLAAHYLPVVAAAKQSKATEVDEGSGRVSFYVSAIDLTVSLPQTVYSTLAAHDGFWKESSLSAAGDEIIGGLEAQTALDRRDSDNAADADDVLSFIAGDQVGVELGASWAPGAGRMR